MHLSEERKISALAGKAISGAHHFAALLFLPLWGVIVLCMFIEVCPEILRSTFVMEGLWFFTFHPVREKVLPADPILMQRSAMPGRLLKDMCLLPLNTKCSYTCNRIPSSVACINTLLSCNISSLMPHDLLQYS